MKCLLVSSTLSVILVLRTTVAVQLACGPLDIALVVDSSVSILANGHKKTKESLIGLLEGFEYGSDKTRVSLVQFGRGVYTQDDIEFDSYGDTWDGLKDKITNLKWHKGDHTDTGAAIKHMVDHLMKKARDFATPVAIILTDGNSQDYRFTKAQAERAKESGIITFSVGVGPSIKQKELLNIATSEKYIFKADSYDELAEVMKGMIHTVCESSETKCIDNVKADLIFAIDTSGSINPAPFKKGTKFVVDFLKGFNMESGGIRVATTMFSGKVHSRYNIDFGKTPEELYKAIESLRWLAGGTKTYYAIADLTKRVVPQLREGVRHIAFIMTDGASDNPRRTVEEAEKLRKHTDIVAIGIGADVSYKELTDIAGSEENVVHAQDYDHLNEIRDDLIKKVCPDGPDSRK